VCAVHLKQVIFFLYVLKRRHLAANAVRHTHNPTHAETHYQEADACCVVPGRHHHCFTRKKKRRRTEAVISRLATVKHSFLVHSHYTSMEPILWLSTPFTTRALVWKTQQQKRINECTGQRVGQSSAAVALRPEEGTCVCVRACVRETAPGASLKQCTVDPRTCRHCTLWRVVSITRDAASAVLHLILRGRERRTRRRHRLLTVIVVFPSTRW
jgi:hypothetical protein